MAGGADPGGRFRAYGHREEDHVIEVPEVDVKEVTVDAGNRQAPVFSFINDVSRSGSQSMTFSPAPLARPPRASAPGALLVSMHALRAAQKQHCGGASRSAEEHAEARRRLAARRAPNTAGLRRCAARRVPSAVPCGGGSLRAEAHA
eukprot:TRINITY_DN14893_c0_g1_i11.p1 TRINITY_DN14893_c0_g1~~TRINITY_DN14893_c0_g1_i11.p1  ORF type:complete len:147 (+),score=10.04 TRINITY_DN14893_c0_g1_i11:169-609(+)